MTKAPDFRSRARSGPREGAGRTLGDLMGPALGKHRLGAGISRAQPLLLWPQAAGPELARLTRARSFQRGVLFVETRDSAAAHHLSMQRHHFVPRLNALLRAGAGSGWTPPQVTDIQFGTGWAAPPAPQPAPQPLPPASAAERAAAQALAQAAPPALQAAVQQAAETLARSRRLKLAQGWGPCPVCGEPTPVPAHPCAPCARLLQDPLVQRGAGDLVRRPEMLPALAQRLGPDGAEAARFLALQKLEGQLHHLAPECVRAGTDEYHHFLEQQARFFLALLGRISSAEVTPAGWSALPDGVRRVLQAGQGW